jgi:xanthine phosphoribosyltransferase
VIADCPLKAGSFSGILAVTCGGMIPAYFLAKKLGVKLVETICLSSYQNGVQSNLFVIGEPPKRCTEVKGEGWLVVEDIIDTGNSLRLLEGRFPKATFYSLVAKKEGLSMAARLNINICVSQVVPQDTWVVFPWEPVFE